MISSNFELKRKVYDVLLSWKNKRQSQQRKEALIIKGARQIGKSSIVQIFGKKEYESYVEINFITNPELKEIFSGSLESNEILRKISIFKNDMMLIPGKTLIFLDEIQACGSARTAIKFLASDFRYDLIVSGSLLGLEYGEDADENVETPESVPVGFEYPVMMYSLDFEEFLWALGYNDSHISYLKEFFDRKEKVPNAINDKFESIFRDYMIVGGMPEVVASYAVQHDYNEVIRIQNKILADYQEDISKHAKGEQKLKVRACYDSIPKQLARELKRFQYAFVEKRQGARKYGGSVKWLKDSNLVHPCYNVREPYIPLMANEIDEQFKLYINDTGLLTGMYGRATKIEILNDKIKGNARGAVYENVISECLVKKGYILHYYKPDDSHELEFLIETDKGVMPVEVKAGTNPSKSLNDFIDEFKPESAYKITSGNVGFKDGKTTIPHYMVIFI